MTLIMSIISDSLSQFSHQLMKPFIHFTAAPLCVIRHSFFLDSTLNLYCCFVLACSPLILFWRKYSWDFHWTGQFYLKRIDSRTYNYNCNNFVEFPQCWVIFSDAPAALNLIIDFTSHLQSCYFVALQLLDKVCICKLNWFLHWFFMFSTLFHPISIFLRGSLGMHS